MQQLRAFVVVADELHFGRAAARLHMSQPPLSRMVRALEDTLGVQLLERTSRRVVLTPAGAVLAGEAQQLLARLDRVRRTMQEMAAGRSRSLVVGFIETAAFDLLPRVLAAFRRRMPDVDLELHEMHTPEAVQGLRGGELDCAILRLPLQESDIEFEFAYEDELVAVVPDRHSVDTDAIALDRLAGDDFVVYHARLGAGITTAVVAACAAAGFTPRIAHYATSTPMLLTLVAAGEGVALVSGPVSLVPRPGVRFVPLCGAPARSMVALAWRRSEDTATLRLLREVLREQAPRLTA